ncbi:amyloid beta A4 precursor protein-binding family A member 1, partial [Lates japonicus]
MLLLAIAPATTTAGLVTTATRRSGTDDVRPQLEEVLPGRGRVPQQRRQQEEQDMELLYGAQSPQPQQPQPIPRPAVTRYRRQGDSEARIRAQQQRHRQRQQREAERAQHLAQQQEKQHLTEMTQEDERERDDSVLARSASTESGFHTHTDRAEGDDGLVMMSLEPEGQPEAEDEAGNYGVQLRPEAEGYTESAEAEQQHLHPHPNYPPQTPPLPHEPLPDIQNRQRQDEAEENTEHWLLQLCLHPAPQPLRVKHRGLGRTELDRARDTESLQQRRAGFRLLEGRAGGSDYHQQEAVGSRLRHYDERSDGESDSPEKEAEFAPYPRADSCEQEEDIDSIVAEVKESLSSQSLHCSAEDTIDEENELPQEEEKPRLESQTDSDKHHKAANRGKPARKQTVSPSEEPVAARNSQEKRDAISLAIKDIKEAIEEVKTRTVRSPYTPDEPKEPIWWRREHQHRCSNNGSSESVHLNNSDPGLTEVGPQSCAGRGESVNGQRHASEPMEIDRAPLPDPRDSKRLKRGVLLPAPPGLPCEHSFVSSMLDRCSNPEQRRFALAYKKVRAQTPPPASLHQEWSLEPYGQRGSWGYVFKYKTGEMCLYQRDEGETLGAWTDLATLSSNDWGVLKLVNPRNVSENEEEEEEQADSVPAKKQKLSPFPSANELCEQKETFAGIWLTKTSGTGRWFYRASYKMQKEEVSEKGEP